MAADPAELSVVADVDEYLDAVEAPGWAASLPADLPDPDSMTAPDETPLDLVPVRQRWRITNDDEAEWAMRHLARAEEERRRIVLKAEERLERIRTWMTAALRPPERTVYFFAALLEDYGVRCRRENDKRATIPLPSGPIKTSKRQPAVFIHDEDALIAWAKENRPDLVHTTEKVLVSEVRPLTKIVDRTDGDATVKAVVDAETGEPVPGVIVSDEEITAKPAPILEEMDR